jgi:hypothetical protein
MVAQTLEATRAQPQQPIRVWSRESALFELHADWSNCCSSVQLLAQGEFCGELSPLWSPDDFTFRFFSTCSAAILKSNAEVMGFLSIHSNHVSNNEMKRLNLLCKFFFI